MKQVWSVIIGLLIIVLLILAGFSIRFHQVEGEWPWQRETLKNPLAGLAYIHLFDTQSGVSQPPRVLGFLPYWTMAEATQSAALTDIAYFSVTLDGQGKLVERDDDGNVDPGLNRLDSELLADWMEQAHADQQKVHVTITVLRNDDVTNLLLSQSAQQQAVNTIEQLVVSAPFDGVVIDIEYTGEVTDTLRQRYTDFLAKVNQSLEQVNPNLELSAAVFGSAASKYQLWDTGAMAEHLDYVIVMTYDYHVRSSATAGPVAPIFGKGEGRWQDDIITNLRDLLKVVPPEKVFLGIPFYGYEWTTTSADPGANTFPSSGLTATYKRVAELLRDAEANAREHWDEDALSPYITYRGDRGETQLIYYENARSISYKADLVKELRLGGMAIWAIGYEGPHAELWQVISNKFNEK